MLPAPGHSVSDLSVVPDEARALRDSAALQVCQARLAMVEGALHALPDGVVIVDPAGSIVDVNPVAVHLSGWSATDALGQHLHQVVHLLDTQGRDVDLLSTESRGGNDAAVLVRRDAHQLQVDAAATPVFDRERRRIGTVVTFRNVTAAKRIADELTYHATHDPLTGVHNRRVFESRLDRAVHYARTHGTPHALLYLDMDRFKAVNDQGGHFAGDALLRAFSALLRRTLREHDTLARLGGDEFAMLLENCSPEEAATVADRIRIEVEEFRFTWQEAEFEVGASIGLVTFDNGALTPEALLLKADELCYQAKTAGRDQARAGRVEWREQRN